MSIKNAKAKMKPSQKSTNIEPSNRRVHILYIYVMFDIIAKILRKRNIGSIFKPLETVKQNKK